MTKPFVNHRRNSESANSHAYRERGSGTNLSECWHAVYSLDSRERMRMTSLRHSCWNARGNKCPHIDMLPKCGQESAY
jgi:hypothetical protein